MDFLWVDFAYMAFYKISFGENFLKNVLLFRLLFKTLYFEIEKWNIIMKEKSIKINAILNVLLTLSNIVFPLITFPYISRVLNPTGVGVTSFYFNQ